MRLVLKAFWYHCTRECLWIHSDGFTVVTVCVLSKFSFLFKNLFDAFLLFCEISIDHIGDGLLILFKLLGFQFNQIFIPFKFLELFPKNLLHQTLLESIHRTLKHAQDSVGLIKLIDEAVAFLKQSSLDDVIQIITNFTYSRFQGLNLLILRV